MTLFYQKWRDLLFLHWQCDPEIVQKRLPPLLRLDTYEGKAYVGVIPFRMEGIRLKGTPPLPGLSRCLELNFRTYVKNLKGEAGIWFFSLDISKSLFAVLARTFFHLPYFAAEMDFKQENQDFQFSSKKKGSAPCHFHWNCGESIQQAKQGSLDHFLIERRRLYTYHQQRLYWLDIAHELYPLQAVNLQFCEHSLFNRHQIPLLSSNIVHSVYSPGVDVSLGPLKH